MLVSSSFILARSGSDKAVIKQSEQEVKKD